MTEELRDGEASRDERRRGIDVVLVTGLSGAGRGTAAKVLEDLGWYVADNLPPELIARMVELGLAAGSRITQLAVVMDVRSRGFTGDLEWVRNDLATRQITPRVLFLEASDDILVRRYEQNRRSHPLQGNQTLAEGIAAERSDAGAGAGGRRPGHRHVGAVGARAAGEHRAGLRRRDRGAHQRHRRVVRIQVRAADGRRHRDGRPVPAQPALGRRTAAAHGPARPRCAITCWGNRARRSSWTPTIDCWTS